MMMKVTSLALAALVLAACGRAGPPYTPSEAARIEAKDKNLPVPAAPVANVNNPDKPFILDGLLD